MYSMLAGLISSIMDHVESSAPLDIIDLTGDSPVSLTRDLRRTMPSRSGITTREHRLSAARQSIMEIPSSSQTNNVQNSIIEILDDAMNPWDMLDFNRLHPPEPTFTNNHGTTITRTRRQQTTESRARSQRQLSTQQGNNATIATNNPVSNVAPYINDSIGNVPMSLTCPICFDTLSSTRKPMSTRCGHVFCAVCLNASLRSSNKCPKCKNKIVKNSCIRLYF